MNSDNPVPQWSLLHRILFRFALAYLLLYNLFGGNSQLLQPLWDVLVPWVGEQVFAVSLTARQITGSGDTTFDYLLVFCLLMLALAATAIWTIIDWKRPHYQRAQEWLRVLVRYALALTMIFYGAAKAIPVQMPSPSLDRLLQPIGDASPMGLLWTFMGSSKAYLIFTGVAEILGGLLLTTRRTTLLGALICLGVTSHIVMLNLCYDVPVKLLSSHLLLMSIFLLLPDAGRLANLLLFHRAIEPAEIRPLFRHVWLNRGVLLLRTVCVIGFTALMLLELYTFDVTAGDLSPRSPLYGIWNVEEMTINGKVHPPLLTDASRWRRVVFDRPWVVSFQLMNDARHIYLVELDTDKCTLTLTQQQDPAWKAAFTFQRLAPDLLVLEGTMNGQSIRAQLRRTDESQFLLTRRGFRWINEVPFNR